VVLLDRGAEEKEFWQRAAFYGPATNQAGKKAGARIDKAGKNQV
jgi:hypothetical protein